MNLSDFKDNRSSCLIEGVVPPRTKDEATCLGIDEAGRGPVLGPMVYGTCFCPLSIKDEIRDMGLADSKTLTEQQREAIFVKINEATDLLGWIVHILSPNDISTGMLRRFKYNLNELSHDTAIDLIKKVISHGVNLKEVYVDTVGDPVKYQAKLENVFPGLDITVAKKADAIYPIVGAASICAKVARDRIVKDWQFSEGIECTEYGSGYPSDPTTKQFMKTHLDPVFGYPHFVRFSWSTASVKLDSDAVPVRWEDDDTDETKDAEQPAISSYFGSKKNRVVTKKHRFFEDNCLSQVSTL